MLRRISSQKSSAKINLYLDILNKRKDEYHNIRTIFAEIDLYDSLNFTLTKNKSIKILTTKCFVNTKDNLIYKVAFFIQNKYNVNWGVKVQLEKNIPVGAGLGGGSSNAALTIKVLSNLWGLGLSLSEMEDIARRFGSDINFFLYGGVALGEDRGDMITPLTGLEVDNILLVNPGFEIASSQAYGSLDFEKLDHPEWRDIIENKKIDYCYNALEDGICLIYPEIKELKQMLITKGAEKAMLSGSGPTVIGFFKDRKTVREAATFFTENKVWNIITKTRKRSTK